MRALTKRERFLLVTVGIIAFLVVSETMIISPLTQRLAENREGVAQAEEILARYRNLVSQEKSILKQYRKLDLASEETAVSTASVDLVSDLQRSASGLFDFGMIRPTETIGSSHAQRVLAAECNCMASFDNIVKFIHRLEVEQGDYVIMNMNLTVSSTEPDMLHANFFIESRGD